MVVDVVID